MKKMYFLHKIIFFHVYVPINLEIKKRPFLLKNCPKHGRSFFLAYRTFSDGKLVGYENISFYLTYKNYTAI